MPGELDHRRRASRRRPIVAGALLLLSATLVACQVEARTPPAAPRTATLTAPYEGITAGALAHGRWSRLPAAPIPDRDDPIGMWTGRELLVWGGESGRNGAVLHGDGAAYDPARRVWRKLPPAPLTPRTGMAATWTGRELIVWGGYDHLGEGPGSVHAAGDGAAYDPERRAWRRLSPAPVSARGNARVVWTGREVLLVAGIPAVPSGAHMVGTAGAAYDPERDSWRRLPPSPRPRGSLIGQHLVWTGARLLVWSDWRQTLRSHEVTLTDGARATEMETQDGIDLWSYDPALDRWTVLPPASGQPALVGAVMAWTGREVLSVAGRPTGWPSGGPEFVHDPGARYDPARNRWRRLADGPLDAASPAAALWTGAALLVLNRTATGSGGDPATRFGPGDGAAWDPAADRWARLPRSPLGGADSAVTVWTGREARVWGGTWWPTPAGHAGLVFTPAGS